MKTVNETELAGLGLTPADYLVSQFNDLLSEDQVLVCCINNERTSERGYLVGIATLNQSGYLPTTVVLEEHNYRVASNWIDQANAIITGKSQKEISRIVLSSMKPFKF